MSLGFGLSDPLVEFSSWRRTFILGAGAIAVAGIGLRWVPEHGECSTVAVDVPRALLLTAGPGAVLVGLIEAGALAAVGAGGIAALALRPRAVATNSVRDRVSRHSGRDRDLAGLRRRLRDTAVNARP